MKRDRDLSTIKYIADREKKLGGLFTKAYCDKIVKQYSIGLLTFEEAVMEVVKAKETVSR